MDRQSQWLLFNQSKIGYGLFSYALQPAKRTSASLIGAIHKEYLVKAVLIYIFSCFSSIVFLSGDMEDMEDGERKDEVDLPGLHLTVPPLILHSPIGEYECAC